MAIIKELDNRASLLINEDQAASFAKNQVKLVKKFLEQQLALKVNIRNKFHEQLGRDHKAVLDSVNYQAPFADRNDFLKRLAPYHIIQKTMFEPSEEEHTKCNLTFFAYSDICGIYLIKLN